MTAPTCAAILRAETGPCETCGHDGHAEMRVEKRVVQHDTYCWECNEEHPYLGPRAGVCEHERDEHPDEGMVRFEWAETARPDGLWYYRRADLAEPSVLRRDHAFTEEIIDA